MSDSDGSKEQHEKFVVSDDGTVSALARATCQECESGMNGVSNNEWECPDCGRTAVVSATIHEVREERFDGE